MCVLCLISGREVVSVLYSIAHWELSLGFGVAVLTPLTPLAVGPRGVYLQPQHSSVARANVRFIQKKMSTVSI